MKITNKMTKKFWGAIATVLGLVLAIIGFTYDYTDESEKYSRQAVAQNQAISEELKDMDEEAKLRDQQSQDKFNELLEQRTNEQVQKPAPERFWLYEYALQEDESLSWLASFSRVSLSEILEHNPVYETRVPSKGSKVQVPFKSVIAFRGFSSRVEKHIATIEKKNQSTEESNDVTSASNDISQPDIALSDVHSQKARINTVVEVKGYKIELHEHIHYVRGGETFLSVIKKYKIGGQVMIDLNPETEDAPLRVGQALRLPAYAQVPISELGRKRSTNSFYSYKVERGTNLYEICQKYNITYTELQDANPRININNLTIGEYISIPRYGQKSTIFD